MKLPEFHVLERNAGARRHANTVSGVDEGVRAGRVDAPRATRREQRRLRLQDHDLAGFHLEGDHAEHVALLVADEIERHPFDKELGARTHVALIQGVQHRVAGAVSGRAGALDRALAVVARVAAEWTLIDLAVVEPVERHSEVLELDHDLHRFAAHELDRVLVTEVV
jgi:hypothetical protein